MPEYIGENKYNKYLSNHNFTFFLLNEMKKLYYYNKNPIPDTIIGFIKGETFQLPYLIYKMKTKNYIWEFISHAETFDEIQQTFQEYFKNNQESGCLINLDKYIESFIKR